MHARSALFDVYGDHLRTHDDRAPVAALVRLLDPVGVAAPAVRTAISRMVGQGWLEPVSLASGRGYRATDRAIRRFDDTAARIYRRKGQPWNGDWHLVLIQEPRIRTARERLRADVEWLGYARLAEGIWVSAFPHPDLAATVTRGHGRLITAAARDFDPPTAPLAAWDLGSLGAAYDAWLTEAPGLLEICSTVAQDADRAAFAARFKLVHEWRKFLFTDPGLPDELLPKDWPGHRARIFFSDEAERLREGADRFVTRALDG